MHGEDVVTSIDPELQNDATAAFTAAQTSGGIIVMDPRTGEILAAAGTPLSQTQPPGSTFKIVTATGVLEAGIANIDSTFPYGTYALIDGYKLHNSNDEDCGGTLLNAFAVSCNSVYAPLGVELGAQRLVATAERYGFNSPSPDSARAGEHAPPGRRHPRFGRARLERDRPVPGPRLAAADAANRLDDRARRSRAGADVRDRRQAEASARDPGLGRRTRSAG